jgi:RNA polymerase sigma-70 factor (TIGR02943 family)
MHENLEFAQTVQSHRVYLLRFAKLQLRNDAWAEDAVSETVLAALSKPQNFAHRSQLKTWLVGILKHKVVDQIRANARMTSISAHDDDGEDLDAHLFDASGHFIDAPSDWGNPEQTLGQQEFFKLLEACLEKLPPALGRVFLMREWLELSCEEVCKDMQITSTNLYVQLHRARARLRECLELTWSKPPAPLGKRTI